MFYNWKWPTPPSELLQKFLQNGVFRSKKCHSWVSCILNSMNTITWNTQTLLPSSFISTTESVAVTRFCHSSTPPGLSGRALIGWALDQSEASILAGHQISNQCVCVIQIHTARILMTQLHRYNHILEKVVSDFRFERPLSTICPYPRVDAICRWSKVAGFSLWSFELWKVICAISTKSNSLFHLWLARSSEMCFSLERNQVFESLPYLVS